jgi:hypothetical protein
MPWIVAGGTPATTAPNKRRAVQRIRVIRVMRGGLLSQIRVHSCNSCLTKRKAPGGVTLPALSSLRLELFPVLLRADYKLDPAAVLQVDAEGIGRARVQVAGVHVKLPVVTAKGEGDVRDVIGGRFVYEYGG